MRKFLLSWIVNTLALLAVAHIVSGIVIENWTAAVVAALVLGILNAFLRPLLIFITLPLTILSLGLFTFIINAFLFYLAAKLVHGFSIAGFWSAFWGALLFSLISLVLNLIIRPGHNSPPHDHGRGQRRVDQPRGRVIEAEVVPQTEKDKDKEKK